ncbi:T9SS C-terminal target domain-containing protein [Lacihabitans sp. LS3-19]|uniref:T9SS type A sorting domain-containing protein n=1 Tax=Lacihabitans sp. LS3-19 TaxID=2487335 RepID=UPI0020CF8239|nr:T9SS type A sorting domain-containing protein [Lacihabitans sp. LS3-19]MCP9767437.1 T9SS C-terminal target domain-containing protein [Lacihabitans sp. LS3-19]
MRKLLLFFYLITVGLSVNANTPTTVVAASLGAPILSYYPSTVTPTSFLISVSDTNATEVAIEIEAMGGGLTRTIIVPAGSNFNQSLTNLLPKTYFAVRARALGCATSTGCGTVSSWSPVMPVLTLVAAPPKATLTLENNCPSFVGFQIRIDERPEDISEFIIKRSFDGSNFHTLANIGPGERSYYDIGPAPGITTHYVVYTRNSTGLTVSNTLTVPVQAYVAPAAPQNLISSFSGKTDTQLHIIWENAPEDTHCGTNIRAAYYIMVKREGEADYSLYSLTYPATTDIYITGLKPNETVSYDVFSISDKNIFSGHAGGTDKTYGPASAPSNFIGVAYKDALNNSSIGLSWDHPLDDEDYFIIEVSEDGTNYLQLGKFKTAEVNTFKHEPIQEGVDYIYRIKAGNYLFGESDWVTTQKIMYPYSKAPNAPFGLSSKASTSGVDLTWYDDSNNEENFILERSVDDNQNFVELAKLGRNVITYTDKTVTAGKTYFYQVKAMNTIGSSAASNISEIKVIATSGVINEELIGLFPNPTLNYVTVNLPEGVSNQNVEISLLDQKNRTVYSKTFNSQKIEVNMSELKPGLYNLVIKSNEFKSSKKVYKY